MSKFCSRVLIPVTDLPFIVLTDLLLVYSGGTLTISLPTFGHSDVVDPTSLPARGVRERYCSGDRVPQR